MEVVVKQVGENKWSAKQWTSLISYKEVFYDYQPIGEDLLRDFASDELAEFYEALDISTEVLTRQDGI